MTAYITLNEDHFRTLVMGGVAADSALLGPHGEVTLVVKFILSDIGFDAMRKAIDEAEAAVDVLGRHNGNRPR